MITDTGSFDTWPVFCAVTFVVSDEINPYAASGLSDFADVAGEFGRFWAVFVSSVGVRAGLPIQNRLSWYSVISNVGNTDMNGHFPGPRLKIGANIFDQLSDPNGGHR